MKTYLRTARQSFGLAVASCPRLIFPLHKSAPRLSGWLLAALLVGSTLPLAAQTVPSPSQTDAIIIDNGASGKADPGDRIRYRVDVQNTGAATATNVQLTANPDPRTTLVGSSFRTSPLAAADAYAVTGNVPINVPAASGLLVNDFDDNIGALAATAGTFATAQNGSITISANGAFTYTPPAGFTGSDTYSYTLNDGNGVGAGVPATDVGVITFTVSNLIWFIDAASPAATTDGRLTTPFKTLAQFNSGSANAGDVIYIEHNATPYNGGIVLQNNERLFGEGHTGAANLTSVLPFVLAPHSVALPAINGSRPVITNTTAGGDGIALAMNNIIRGVDIGAAADFAIDDNGAAGTLTISEVAINNTSGGGFRTDNGGTLAVTLGALTASGGVSGVHLSGTGGSFTVTGATTISNSTGSGVLIDGTTSGATASFAAIIVANTGSHAVQLINNTGTFNASGLTTINAPVAGANMSLNIAGGSGAITFAGIDINGRRDKGIRISSGNRNITTGAVDIENPNTSTAIGLEILSPTGGTIAFGATTINNNAASGSAVEIQNSAATVTFASGSAISNSASHEFFVNQGNGNITFNGSITSTAGAAIAVNSRTGGTTSFTGTVSSSGAGIGIQANNNTGGTIEFSGSTKTINSTTAAAVSLTTNTNTTINFTNGGLAISTTTGAGFTATGGGTVSVTGSGNTINSTAATALNITSTNIGAGDVTFQSISSTGATKGIIVNTTGAAGSLIVTGTGTTNGSGGTISNISQRGIEAISTTGLSLKNMTLNNANTTDGAGPCGASENSGCNAAIHLSDVTGATLDNIDITTTAQNGINVRETSNLSIANSTVTQTGAGGQTEEGGLYALNIFGTVSITNSQFTFPAVRGAVIYNTNKTVNMTVTGSEFSDTQTSAVGADGFEMSSFGTSNTTLTITNCTFMRDKTNGIQFITDNTALGDITVTGSTVDPGSGVGVPMDFSSNGTSTLKYKILNNPVLKGRATSLVNMFAQGNSSMMGRINGNTITHLAGGGGNNSGTGIRIIAQENTTDHIVEILNNTITGIAADAGISIQSRTSGTPRIDATIMNNNVTIAATATYAIQALAGASNDGSNSIVCTRIANNTTTAPVGTLGNAQLRVQTAAGQLLLQGPGTSVQNYWDSNGNTPTTGSGGVVSGPGIFPLQVTYNAPACATPTN